MGHTPLGLRIIEKKSPAHDASIHKKSTEHYPYGFCCPTLRLSRARKRERGTSGRWRASAAGGCSAQDVTRDAGLPHPSARSSPSAGAHSAVLCQVPKDVSSSF